VVLINWLSKTGQKKEAGENLPRKISQVRKVGLGLSSVEEQAAKT
jgi:hypothetical protein